MSSDDDFQEIISNMGDAENEDGDEFETPLDVIAHYWKHFHKGEIFTKGILIVESVVPDENGETRKALRMITSEPIFSWEVMGMLKYCQEHLLYVSGADDDDDEDDDE